LQDTVKKFDGVDVQKLKDDLTKARRPTPHPPCRRRVQSAR
jgi:hypothetical protein